MYDAEVSINCSATGDKSDYYKITPSGAMTIAGKTTGTGNVQVKLLKASVEDIHETFTCTLTAISKERSKKAETPIYYAFGDPLTAIDRTIDYATLKYPDTDTQAIVFVKLEESQKSVCTLATGSLECFKPNNETETQEHLKRLFGEENCSSNSSYLHCNASIFHGFVFSIGVQCDVNGYRCQVGFDGYVGCGLVPVWWC